MDRRRKTGAIDRLVRYIPICITALLALACVLGARRYSLDSWEDLLNYTPPSLLGAAVLLLCGYALKSLSVVFPLSLLYVAAGVMLPLWMAWGVNLLGLLVCITLPYWVGRISGGNWRKVFCGLTGRRPGRRRLSQRTGCLRLIFCVSWGYYQGTW